MTRILNTQLEALTEGAPQTCQAPEEQEISPGSPELKKLKGKSLKEERKERE